MRIVGEKDGKPRAGQTVLSGRGDVGSRCRCWSMQDAVQLTVNLRRESCCPCMTVDRLRTEGRLHSDAREKIAFACSATETADISIITPHMGFARGGGSAMTGPEERSEWSVDLAYKRMKRTGMVPPPSAWLRRNGIGLAEEGASNICLRDSRLRCTASELRERGR